MEFRVTWGRQSAIACAASRPDAGGTWSCPADLLKIGVLPGPIILRVRGFDTSERVVAGTSAARSATYGVVPPKPGNAKFKIVSKRFNRDGSTTETDRISWTSPAGYATEFRLYGVTVCPNESQAHDGEPCLVPHTPLEASSLKQIKTVKGTARSMLITEVTPPDACGPTLWCSDYFALVLGAFNSYGQSVYAIPFSTSVCYECTY